MKAKWMWLLPVALLLPLRGFATDYFVAANDPNAGDDRDGSAKTPWKTISHAAKCLQPGDTVWVHGGVYRETVLVEKSGTGPDRMIAFRAVPGEQVVVKGSEVIRDWTRAPSEPNRPIWEATWPWEGIYPGMVGADDAPLVPLSVPPETDALKPPAAYCQYFQGFGRGQAEMLPGSFCYDAARKKLLVWLKGDEDPNRHVMEGAVRACWDSRGDYLLVEGMTFRYAPLVVPVGGIVFVMTGPGGGGVPAEGCLVRDCEVSLGAFEGMYVRGAKNVTTVVEDCWVHHNGDGAGGFEGLGAPESDAWLVVRRCRLTDNNLFNWNPSWHAGGKHFGRRVLFDQCEFARNYHSPGVWFDCRARDCIVNGCYAHDSGQFQLYYEIGETGAFLNNVAQGAPNCAVVGFMGSSRSLLAHNLVLASERGILVGGEGATEGKAARVTCHNSVYNNIVVGHGAPVLTVTSENDLARDNAADNNLFWQTKARADEAAGLPLFEVGVSKPAVSFASWQQQRRADLASRLADPRVENQGGRLTRLPGSPALTGGRRLTPDVLRDLFALKPIPPVLVDNAGTSMNDHQPASPAFLAKVAELLAVPAGRDVLVGPLANAGVVSGKQLPVAEASFETPALGVNATSASVRGWTTTEDALIWHAEGTGLWNWYCPEGKNVLVLGGGGKEPAEVSASQVLRETLQANTRYVLSVWAGQRMDQAAAPWPQVTMALYAGTRLLKSVELPEPKIAPHYGVWIENLVTYTSPGSVPPGQPLKIVLSRRGSSPAQACLDNVTLWAERHPTR